MKKADIDNVYSLLKYVGGLVGREKYEGKKPITMIDVELWDEGRDAEAILETFSKGDYLGTEWQELDVDDFLVEADGIRVWVYTHRCSECGALMWDGYVVEDGFALYCSDECLHKHFTDDEWEEMYADGDGDSYWTAWY